MATTTIAAQTIPSGGFNLTDATFETMTIGAGNGVEFPYQANDKIVLQNGTAGSAIITFKVPTPGQYSDRGATIPDVTLTLDANKTLLYPVSGIFRQSTGTVIIESDTAIEVLVLRG